MSRPLENRIVECCRDIVTTYEKEGYLPTYFQLLPGGDPSFKLGDRCIYYRYRPNLRGNLILSFLIKPLFFWTRFGDRRLSRSLNLRSRLCFSFHTFFNDVFVVEALLSAMNDFSPIMDNELFSRCYRVCCSILSGMIDNLESFQTAGGNIEVINFFPPKDHRMNPKSWIYRKITRWKIDPDFDCTFGNLAAFDSFLRLVESNTGGRIANPPADLIQRIHNALDNPAFLDLIQEFQALPGAKHSARITINHLGAENGGIMTWIGNRENDVDPAVNINVLTVVLKNRTRWGLFQRPAFLQTLQSVLQMLARTVRTGDFLSARTHIYYLPVVFCCKFGRFYHEFNQMSAAEQKMSDPLDLVSEMRGHIEAALLSWTSSGRLSKLDAAYIAAALLEIGYRGPVLSELANQLEPEPHTGGRDGLPHLYRSYEFFKQKVPFKFIYGSEATSAGFALRAFVRLAETECPGQSTAEVAATGSRR